MKTEIFRDGKLLQTFEGEKASTKAFGWMLSHNSMSINWALKYEGYEIIDTSENGEKTYWKYI